MKLKLNKKLLRGNRIKYYLIIFLCINLSSLMIFGCASPIRLINDTSQIQNLADDEVIIITRLDVVAGIYHLTTSETGMHKVDFGRKVYHMQMFFNSGKGSGASMHGSSVPTERYFSAIVKKKANYIGDIWAANYIPTIHRTINFVISPQRKIDRIKSIWEGYKIDYGEDKIVYIGNIIASSDPISQVKLFSSLLQTPSFNPNFFSENFLQLKYSAGDYKVSPKRYEGINHVLIYDQYENALDYAKKTFGENVKVAKKIAKVVKEEF